MTRTRRASQDCLCPKYLDLLAENARPKTRLKRDTLDIVAGNPTSRECRAFAETLVPWLCAAMSLRAAFDGDRVTYFVRAARIRHEIETIVAAPARHPAVQGIQNIFRENEHRLWHWTEDPRVPAENNTAERAIRPLATARWSSASLWISLRSSASTHSLILNTCPS